MHGSDEGAYPQRSVTESLTKQTGFCSLLVADYKPI